jgi:hypothetical protein
MNFLDRFSRNRENIKFGENPASGSRVIACGQTNRDMTMLMAVFSNFANASKSGRVYGKKNLHKFYPS